jgi:hypothetical protein
MASGRVRAWPSVVSTSGHSEPTELHQKPDRGPLPFTPSADRLCSNISDRPKRTPQPSTLRNLDDPGCGIATARCRCHNASRQPHGSRFGGDFQPHGATQFSGSWSHFQTLSRVPEQDDRKSRQGASRRRRRTPSGGSHELSGGGGGARRGERVYDQKLCKLGRVFVARSALFGGIVCSAIKLWLARLADREFAS